MPPVGAGLRHPARYGRSPGLGVTRRCACGWNLARHEGAAGPGVAKARQRQAASPPPRQRQSVFACASRARPNWVRANDGRESRAGGILALAEPLRGQPEAAGRALSSAFPSGGRRPSAPWRSGHAITLARSSAPGPAWTQRLDLPAGARNHRSARPPGAARRGHRVRGLAGPLTAGEPRARRDRRIAGELVVTPAPSRNTSAISSARPARPTAPRPSPGRVSWA
jgi:hypothetical protein